MLVHEGDLGGKKHEREQTFRPAQSVSADTLALNRKTLETIGPDPGTPAARATSPREAPPMESNANWTPQSGKVADNIWDALDIDN